jgi:hypothetical protein
MEQVESLLKRPKLYYNIDGVAELGMGFMMLAFGLFGWVQEHTPRGSVWHQMWVFAVYMTAMVLILHYGPKALKARYTYPRTGFVEYRSRDRVWPAIAAAVLAPVVAVGCWFAFHRHWNWAALSTLYGLALAAGYAYQIARTVRWKWVVAAALAFISPVLSVSFTLFFLLYGALFTVSGAISFCLYLRHTREEQ